jgi:hypothetical protein
VLEEKGMNGLERVLKSLSLRVWTPRTYHRESLNKSMTDQKSVSTEIAFSEWAPTNPSLFGEHAVHSDNSCFSPEFTFRAGMGTSEAQKVRLKARCDRWLRSIKVSVSLVSTETNRELPGTEKILKLEGGSTTAEVDKARAKLAEQLLESYSDAQGEE